MTVIWNDSNNHLHFITMMNQINIKITLNSEVVDSEKMALFSILYSLVIN